MMLEVDQLLLIRIEILEHTKHFYYSLQKEIKYEADSIFTAHSHIFQRRDLVELDDGSLRLLEVGLALLREICLGLRLKDAYFDFFFVHDG